jgi:phosphohistidine phosphatase
MNLILWRHADAVSHDEDLKRELSDKGKKQAAKMARWLKQNTDKNWEVLVSPAKRAIQTASAFSDDFRVCLTLAPDATSFSILREAQWPDNEKNVIVVSHQPILGHVASKLLTGVDGDVSLKKGAIWWFVAKDPEDGITGLSLKAVIAPDQLPD